MSFGQKSGSQQQDGQQQASGLPAGIRGLPVRTRQAGGGRGVRAWCSACDEDVCICKVPDLEAGS